MELKDVETIWDFRDFLSELANKNPTFYAPLSLHYQLVLDRHKKVLRVIGIFNFIFGLIAGFCLGRWF